MTNKELIICSCSLMHQREENLQHGRLTTLIVAGQQKYPNVANEWQTKPRSVQDQCMIEHQLPHSIIVTVMNGEAIKTLRSSKSEQAIWECPQWTESRVRTSEGQSMEEAGDKSWEARLRWFDHTKKDGEYSRAMRLDVARRQEGGERGDLWLPWEKTWIQRVWEERMQRIRGLDCHPRREEQRGEEGRWVIAVAASMSEWGNRGLPRALYSLEIKKRLLNLTI